MLGKDDFLRLLTTQLRFQDPLSPMQGTEFAAQLAQFSSVEQLANINTNLTQSIDANYLMSQSISNALATTFVGKDVRAVAASFHASGAGEVRLGYSLNAAAETVTAKIYDDAGNLVKSWNAAGIAKGDNDLTWDGTNDQGQAVAAGKYKLVIDAKDAAGDPVAATTCIVGTVTGVRFKAEGTVFVIDGVEVNVSDILEIMQR
jgi:flagellar basal-body rod modification protein FlgD